MSTGGPPDRSAKRLKGDGPIGGHPDGYHGAYGQPQAPQGGFQQPPYSQGPGGQSMGPQSGYNAWQQGQYGNHPPPPHSWGHGSTPTGAMYTQRSAPGITPDRGRYGSGYTRGPPPPIQGSRRGGKPGPPSRPPTKAPDSGGSPDGPQSGYQSGGWGHPQNGQWPQYHWGDGPSSGWQGNGPSMHQPPAYGTLSMYGTNNSPPRGAQGRPRPPSEMTGGFPPGPQGLSGLISDPTENIDIDMYRSRGIGDDDGNSSSAGNSKDKGRGSYKCGRCGAPKKGHVCPYQPKLIRRSGEPLPSMRSAAIQVEMDEFMTVRRLNLKIQGFPESYTTEPFMDDDMVVGEPSNLLGVPPASTPGGQPRADLMTVPDSSVPAMGLPPQDSVGMLSSPIRSSPITDDPITA